MSQNQAKESETVPNPTLGVLQKPSPNIHAEDLGQTHTGSFMLGLVSGSPWEPRLVDPVGFLMMSLTHLMPTTLPPPLLQDSPRSA